MDHVQVDQNQKLSSADRLALLRAGDVILEEADCDRYGQPKSRKAWKQARFERSLTSCPFGNSR